MLYDQLLSSLTGEEGIATERECIAWASEEVRAGRNPLPLDPRAPHRIQRGQGRLLLQAFDWNSYREGHRVCAEAKLLEREDSLEYHLLCTVDEQRLFAEFKAWRRALIDRFHLVEAMLPEVPLHP